MCKSQGISRFVCSITPQSFCIVAVPLLNHANIFLVSQSFKVSLHFFHLIIEVSHQKIDIQHQAKDYLNFKLGKLKEIHRRISRNLNTGGHIPCQQRPLFPRPLFSGIRRAGWKKKNGWVANYEVACFFCMSFADLWLLYGFHWKRFVLSRFCFNPFTFVGFRNS